MKRVAARHPLILMCAALSNGRNRAKPYNAGGQRVPRLPGSNLLHSQEVRST